MVVGLDKAKEIITNNPALNLDVYLIYVNDKGEFASFMSKNMKKIIQEVQ